MEIYKNRRYMVINYSDIDSVNFDEIIQSDKEELRLSIDGTLTIVKWNGLNIPNSLNSLTTKYGPYTHEEMIQIVSTNVWNDVYTDLVGNNNDTPQ
jgi:hypothetical protein